MFSWHDSLGLWSESRGIDAGRGSDERALFSYIEVEARIPAQHPLRAMRRLTDAALAELDRTFSALYEGCGRPSIPPER